MWLSGKAPGRQAAKEITCFNNNIGLGIQFAAIGKAVFDEAKSKGLGREIPTDWFLGDSSSIDRRRKQDSPQRRSAVEAATKDDSEPEN